MKTNFKALSCLSILHAALTHAQPVLVDFDQFNSATDSDLDNNFVSGGSYQQTTTQGITGGAVSSVAGVGGFATYNQPQNQTIGTGISFRYTNPPLQEQPLARVGWAGTPDAIDFSNSSSYFWAEFLAGGLIRIINRNTGDSVSGGASVSPQADHWLNLQFSATPNGAGAQYQLSFVLYDLGASGTEPPVQLAANETGVQNFAAAADLSLFPGFYGDAPLIDNFTIVPEPSALSLLAVPAFLMVIGGWKRHSPIRFGTASG